jgi:NADH dehydrogenase FAD-containing subunit
MVSINNAGVHVMKPLLVIIPLLCALLPACGAKQQADKIAAKEQEHFLKSQEQALRQAEQVEATMLKAAEERRKQIDEQAR